MKDVYTLDSNVFIQMGAYYPKRFPGFWKSMDEAVAKKRIVSCREVLHELQNGGSPNFLEQWLDENRDIFKAPTEAEMKNVAKILGTRPYDAFIRKKQWLGGMPVADPFLVAAAIEHGYKVVTLEKDVPGARIPPCCRHFKAESMTLEEMMEAEDWSF